MSPPPFHNKMQAEVTEAEIEHPMRHPTEFMAELDDPLSEDEFNQAVVDASEFTVRFRGVVTAQDEFNLQFMQENARRIIAECLQARGNEFRFRDLPDDMFYNRTTLPFNNLQGFHFMQAPYATKLYAEERDGAHNKAHISFDGTHFRVQVTTDILHPTNYGIVTLFPNVEYDVPNMFGVQDVVGYATLHNIEEAIDAYKDMRRILKCIISKKQEVLVLARAYGGPMRVVPEDVMRNVMAPMLQPLEVLPLVPRAPRGPRTLAGGKRTRRKSKSRKSRRKSRKSRKSRRKSHS